MCFLQNPNALDSKVLLDFDHVKNSLKVDDEGMLQPVAPSVACWKPLDGDNIAAVVFHVSSGCVTFCFLFTELQKIASDPTYNINVSGDIKQMLQELGTDRGKETAMLGGGGSKAQKERAAALAAILAARSRVKEYSTSNGEAKTSQAFSIVDAASASVHGRSAAAAKASSSDKTAARIAMHMAGDRAPVNAKMVIFSDLISSG